MAKFEVLCENWNEQGVPEFEKVTSFKSEKEALNFSLSEANVGRYGVLYVRTKKNGKHLVYNDKDKCWVEIQ